MGDAPTTTSAGPAAPAAPAAPSDGSGSSRPDEPAPSPLATALGALSVLARVHDRPDLAEAADAAVARLGATRLRVVVMGEFKKGKSSLVNALIDAPISAVDDDIATAARLEVMYADRPTARRWRREQADGGTRVVEVALPVGDAAVASTAADTTMVRAGLRRPLLRAGVVLVDTPGVGGISSAEAVVTASTLRDAHVVVFVSDCSQELTAAELHALRDAVERGPQVVLVETKTDIAPHWRTIVEADREHLAQAGLDVPILPVSTALRTRALRTGDAELNAESGYGELVGLIGRRFVPEMRALAEEAALRTARRVYALLHEPIAVELRALVETDGDAGTGEQVAAARGRVEAFKAAAAGWQQLLGDGVADLVSAVDHDLRHRFRTLVKESEDTLAEADPDDVWETFEATLYRQVAEALDENLTLLRDRADDLARRLAEQLDDAIPADGSDPLTATWDGLDDGATAASSAVADRAETDSTSGGARANQAFRAGYGGAMPIMAVGGMALGVLGLGTLVLPLAAVAGVVAGKKALGDERDRQLAQRRQQARLAVKRYTDDVLIGATNERKQLQRRVQRRLRDHFTARVKELALTHGEALRAAEAAAAADTETRRARIGERRDELARIERVGLELQQALATPRSEPAPPRTAAPPDAAIPGAVPPAPASPTGRGAH